MEMATMSKVLGRFLFALFAGLVPATQPFHAPQERSAASLPFGVYATTANAPKTGDGDALSVARGAKGGYRVVCSSWNEPPLEFDAELFELGKDGEGAPVYFLDLTPRSAHPEKHGLAVGATHFAARVRWTVEGERAWLSFDPVDKSWLGEQESTLGLSTKGLRALLRKAVAAGAFRGSEQLFRKAKS